MSDEKTSGTKERPILFSGAMVRALLAGTKTQTRRVLREQPQDFIKEVGWTTFTPPGKVSARGTHPELGYAAEWYLKGCPYGNAGDRLWVRETWGLHRHHDYTCWNRDSVAGRTADDLLLSWQVAYAADATSVYDHWRPSIHMPRWVSRITLDVTGVRAERLNDISEADARAEGVEIPHDADALCDCGRRAYRDLWDRINGQGSWLKNPWVWVVTFKRLEVSRGQ